MVYVDDGRYRYGRMVMCHMIADSTAELLDMVDAMGLARHWIQKAGTPEEHFDICLSKKQKAIARGAIAITQRDLALRIDARRPAPRFTAEDRAKLLGLSSAPLQSAADAAKIERQTSLPL